MNMNGPGHTLTGRYTSTYTHTRAHTSRAGVALGCEAATHVHRAHMRHKTHISMYAHAHTHALTHAHPSCSPTTLQQSYLQTCPSCRT